MPSIPAASWHDLLLAPRPAFAQAPRRMFLLGDHETAAIRAAFESGGELAAAVELRRLFPGTTDMVHARQCARTPRVEH